MTRMAIPRATWTLRSRWRAHSDVQSGVRWTSKRAVSRTKESSTSSRRHPWFNFLKISSTECSQNVFGKVPSKRIRDPQLAFSDTVTGRAEKCGVNEVDGRIVREIAERSASVH